MSNTRKFFLQVGILAACLVIEVAIVAYPPLDWFLGGMVVAAILLNLWDLHYQRHLKQLAAGLREIAEGNLDHPTVRIDRKDDLGRLATELEVLQLNLQRKRIEQNEALLRAREAPRAAFDALPHGIALLSAEGKLELVNTVAQQLFNLRSDTKEFPKWFDDLVWEVRRTKNPAAGQKSLQVFDKNRELFFTPRAVPIQAPDHQFAGILVLIENATETRQVDEAKSGLLGLVSHELKTPLTSIQMSVHLLLEDPRLQMSDRQRDLLKTAGEDADRLHELIQRLLDKAKH
jgi:signal transduction histidine kinase